MATFESEIRPVIHHLGRERKLPVLETDIIADHLDEGNLIVLGRVSRSLHQQVNRIIYRDVTLDFSDFEKTGRKAVLLLRTLLTNATLAEGIQNLSLQGDFLKDWMKETAKNTYNKEIQLYGQFPQILTLSLSPLTPEETRLYARVDNSLPVTMRLSNGQIKVQALALSILELCTQVSTLQIDSEFFRYQDFRKHILNTFWTSKPKHLKNVSLCKDLRPMWTSNRRAISDVTAVESWDDAIMAAFMIEGIDSITSTMALHPNMMSQLPLSTVTRLTLQHSQEHKYDLNALLAATPRLRYFEYHAVINYGWFTGFRQKGWHEDVGHSSLFGALLNVKDTLEELVATQMVDDDYDPGFAEGQEPPFQQPYELSKLPHLHSLSICHASLFGWKVKTLPDWASILPPAVTSITLYDDLNELFFETYPPHDKPGDWTDKSLMPVFKTLLDFLASRGSSDRAPRFSLVLNNIDNGFNEGERRILRRWCEQRGIHCHIEKVEDDLPVHPRDAAYWGYEEPEGAA